MDDNEQSITPMTVDECWEFLSMQPIGRLGTAVGGEPEIFPLNFAVADRTIYFHTIPGTKVAEVAINEKVAFEVDQWGPEIAYSVVVKGTAEILETDADIAAARHLGGCDAHPGVAGVLQVADQVGRLGRRLRR